MTTKSGCTKCCGIILADTEDWENPLCHAHWVAIGSPEVEPKSEASIEGSTVLYVERSEYYKVLKCWDAEKIRADHLQAQFDSLSAKHERVLQALNIAETALGKIDKVPIEEAFGSEYDVAKKALAQIQELKK